MRIIKYITLIVAMAWSAIQYAQTNENSLLTFPTTPSAYEFLKYGDTPLNEYTGKANISVPIHNLILDEFQLPLAINYNTGGIKVTQEASIVGLGWDFNLPAIVQTINDEDDYSIYTDFQRLPDYVGSNTYPVTGALHPNLGIPGTPNEGDSYPGSTNYTDVPLYFKASGTFIVVDGKYRIQNYQDMIGDLSGEIDSEPDIFTLNLNGVEIIMTTEFRHSNFGQNELTSPMDIEIINGRNEYQIELIENTGTSTSFIKGFKVTDPSSNIYFFDWIDETRTSSTITSPYLGGGQAAGSNEKPSAKIYHLTKVVTNKGNEVIINYNRVNITEIPKIGHEYHRRNGPTSINPSEVNEGNYNAYDSGGPNSIYAYFGSNSIDNLGITSNLHYSNGSYSYFTSIQSPDVNIEFDYSSRIDYTGMPKLDYAKVRNMRNEIIREFDFSYTYFTSPGPADLEERYKKRLRLDAIQEIGMPPYTFAYFDNLPAKNSFNIDYWGYHNGHPNSSLIPSLANLGYPQYSDYSGNDFNSNLNYAKSGSLHRVQYPTRGYTTLEYELNQFDGLFANGSVPNGNQVTEGGGLRIQYRKNYDSNDDLINTREYKYYGGKNMSKRKTIYGFSEKILRNTGGTESPFKSYSTQVLKVSLNNFIQNNPIGEGDYIGYDYVDIIRKGNIDVGYTRKHFVNVPNTAHLTTFDQYFNPIYIRDRGEIKNGSIALLEEFDANNDKVASEIFKYKMVGNKNIYKNHYGVKIKGNGQYIDLFHQNGFFSVNVIIPYFQLSFYPIFSNTTLLEERIRTEYRNNPITTERKIVYDDHNRIQKEIDFQNTSVTNERKETIYQYTYPIYSFPLLIQNRQYTGDNYEVNNEKWFDFSVHPDRNNAILLDQSWDCGRASYPGQIDDSCITSEFKYDSVGNIIEYTKQNSINTSIVYGYNQRYPLAKIENATYNQVLATGVNPSILNNPYSSDTEKITELDKIRNGLSNNQVLITTYLYKPGIGISSSTDSRGYTMTYTYDSSNRLIEVRDANNKLVSDYIYNYKN